MAAREESAKNGHVRQAVYVHGFDVDLLQLAEEVRRRGRARDDGHHWALEASRLGGVEQADLEFLY